MLFYFVKFFAFFGKALSRAWTRFVGWCTDRPIYVRKSELVDDYMSVPRLSDPSQVMVVRLERSRKKWWA